MIIDECLVCDLAGLSQVFLRCEKSVAQAPDREPFSLNSWNPASIKIIFLVEVLLQRTIRIRPKAEVVQPALNLLRPLSVLVSKQRIIVMRLGELARLAVTHRPSRLGHGAAVSSSKGAGGGQSLLGYTLPAGVIMDDQTA